MLARHLRSTGSEPRRWAARCWCYTIPRSCRIRVVTLGCCIDRGIPAAAPPIVRHLNGLESGGDASGIAARLSAVKSGRENCSRGATGRLNDAQADSIRLKSSQEKSCGRVRIPLASVAELLCHRPINGIHSELQTNRVEKLRNAPAFWSQER
jgi:hypothetical protein